LEIKKAETEFTDHHRQSQQTLSKLIDEGIEDKKMIDVLKKDMMKSDHKIGKYKEQREKAKHQILKYAREVEELRKIVGKEQKQGGRDLHYMSM
jgi:hypothetical protein